MSLHWHIIYHTKCMIYTRVYSYCCTVYVGTSIMACVSILVTYRTVSLPLKVSTLHLFLPAFPVVSGILSLFTVSIPLPSPAYSIIRTMLCTSFGDWLLLLSSLHFTFFQSFSWLQWPISFQRWEIFHCRDILQLTPHWRTFFAVSKFYRLPLLQTSVARFCMNIIFQCIWVNDKEHDNWIVRYNYTSFRRHCLKIFRMVVYIASFPLAHECRCLIALHPPQHFVLWSLW